MDRKANARCAMDAINKMFASKKDPDFKVIQTATEIAQDFVTPPRRRFNVEAFNQVTGGGIPYGRFVQIYGGSDCGKTTMCLDACAAAQARGEIVAWINFEGKFDKGWAVQNGVKWDDSFILVPASHYAEEGLQAVLELTERKAVDLVVVDSVVALAAKGELLNTGGDQRLMEQDTQAVIPRMLSKFFRKLVAYSTTNGCSFIFINQLREKLNSYGCLHGDTVIPFVDGRSFSIKEIVDNKIEGYVWSLNSNGMMVPGKITNWYHNGKIENSHEWITILTDGIETPNGINGITVTPDHECLTDSGWKKAKDLSINDKLITKQHKVLNNQLLEFVIGMSVGDSWISQNGRYNGCMVIRNTKQLEYLEWKMSLTPELEWHQSGSTYKSKFSKELGDLSRILGNRNILQVQDLFSDISLAVWYLDDGHFDNKNGHYRVIISVKRFKNQKLILDGIQNLLYSKFGLECQYNINDGSIVFNAENTRKLFNIISKYVPSCMHYKIGETYRTECVLEMLYFEQGVFESIKTPIINISIGSNRKFRNRDKYDIGIDDFKNYLAGNSCNGVIVHNSPETVPGGRAIKHYVCLNVGMRRAGKDETSPAAVEYGGYTARLMCDKMQVSPINEYKLKERDEYFATFIPGKGFDPRINIVEVALQNEVITLSGKSYTFPDGTKVVGRKAVFEAVAANEELYTSLKKSFEPKPVVVKPAE